MCFVALTSLLLLTMVSCGGSETSEPTASNEETEQAEDQTEETEEEEASPCLTDKPQGSKVELLTGKESDEDFDQYRFFPDTLKLEAGKPVTLKIVNDTFLTHTFTSDALGCDTGSIPSGETVTVTFDVPRGTTEFICLPHKQAMGGEIVAR